MDTLKQAMESSDRLATTVAELELHCAAEFGRVAPDRERLIKAIQTVWQRLIADARGGRVSPKVAYIAELYDDLTRTVGIDHPGVFTDRSDIPWHEFYADGCGDEDRCEDAWVIAELYWGGYVENLHLTLGWLLMNAIRIQQNLPAITPIPHFTNRFTDYLRWSGPETFDAESLRALFYEYEKAVTG